MGPLAVVLCPAAVTFPGPVAGDAEQQAGAGFGTTCHERPSVQFSVNALPPGSDAGRPCVGIG